MKFNELELSEHIQRALEEMGFEQATPVQEKTIPLIMQGADVIGHSQTGTGKTAAFGLPAIQRADGQVAATQVLVLCPTRELAVQSCEEIKKFSKYVRGIKAAAVYGGEPIERQISALKRGVQIVIGTPGRIMDHMRRRTLKLDHLKMLVLDEADEMLNMGFREDIETILKDVPEERQTLLFSATMSKEILAITRRYQKDPTIVKIVPEELTVPLIEQIAYQVPRLRKADLVQMVLEKEAPNLAIIFCNTKRLVDELVGELQSRGIRVEGIHGDIKQSTRIHVLNRFKTGRVKVLVATDVAARGIDVDGIDVVINYDIPQDLEYYVHRIGRTGRAGRAGKSFTFVSGRQQMFELREIERYIKTRIKIEPLPTLGEIKKGKVDAFVKKVEAVMAEGELDQSGGPVQRLQDAGYSLESIALALSKMLMDKELKRLQFADIPQESYQRRPDSRPQRNGASGMKRDKMFLSPPGSGMAWLMINMGKSQQINAGHIVAAVAGDGKIAGNLIGDIKLFQECSAVEVPKKMAASVIQNMKKSRIKGKPIKIEKQ